MGPPLALAEVARDPGETAIVATASLATTAGSQAKSAVMACDD